MEKNTSDKELMALYRSRLKDRAQSVTRRRRQIERPLQPFSELLTQYFGKNSEAMQKIEESRAILAWESFVGEAAARFSQAQRVRGDTLIVRVADPLWMQQLSLLKYELLKKYQAMFPRLQLTNIFFTRH